MDDALELAILNAHPDEVLIYGRYNSDIAVSRLSLTRKAHPKSDLGVIRRFQRRIIDTIQGRTKGHRPTASELADFGRRLFTFCMAGDVLDLYRAASTKTVRIQILSDRDEIQEIPWEYMQEPQRISPRVDQSVARIVPLIGQTCPKPLSKIGTVRILFVSAEPLDQKGGISWPEEKQIIEDAFKSRLSRIPKLDFNAVDGTTRASFQQALTTGQKYDILHFSGHGELVNGHGHLIITQRKSKPGQATKSDRIDAATLVQLLSGRALRLVVLSACESASGHYSKEFANIADTLVRQGVAPAVIANQFPMPNSSVAIFMSSMYTSLLQHGDIDYAVSEGRVALSVQLSDNKEAPLEWGIPVVYRHIAGNIMFA